MSHGLVQLPVCSEEISSFIPIGPPINHYLNFEKFNFCFTSWHVHYQSSSTHNSQSNGVTVDEDDDDDEAVDDAVYVTIPDDYSFDIQTNKKKLDPKAWRKQDHYKVLGLDEFRWSTKPEDLRRAYRALILKYHPDKGRVKDSSLDMNDIFSCMTKSYEFLLQPKLRRSYDSYDPEFDDTVPKSKPVQNFNEFKSKFGKHLENNKRWSRHVIPEFGDENSTLEEVDDYYQAWFNFASWREFTYEELEELEQAEDGYERRYMQSQIKKESDKKRKLESKRIRSLVDTAYNLDPRIKKFVREEREKKEQAKADRKAARELEHQKKQQEEQAKIDAENEKREQVEQAERKIRDEERKEREKLKREVRKKRQALRKVIADKVKDSASIESEVNLICTQLEGVQLDEFKSRLTSIDAQNVKSTVLDKYEQIRKKLRKDDQELEAEKEKRHQAAKKENEWTVEDIQILVKAANILPAGTTKRWDKISEYFIDHKAPESKSRTPKECLAAVKNLSMQASQGDQGVAANEDSFSQFLRNKKRENESKPLNGEISLSEPAKEGQTNTPQAKPWSAVEQKLLEQGLRTFPAAMGKDRWDRIAETIPNRSKKECILRLKEITTKLQARKKAMTPGK